MFAERVIHGCIYEARPDVMAVCHHHAAAVLPFCVAGVPIEPVFHLGAASGETTPFWDQQASSATPICWCGSRRRGARIARALGQHAAVLLNRHGATVVGADIRELVSRCIFMCQNAAYQLQAHMLGKVDKLAPGEVKLASTLNALPNVTGRTWEYWTMRLAEAGRLPPAEAKVEAAGESRRQGEARVSQKSLAAQEAALIAPQRGLRPPNTGARFSRNARTPSA